MLFIGRVDNMCASPRNTHALVLTANIPKSRVVLLVFIYNIECDIYFVLLRIIYYRIKEESLVVRYIVVLLLSYDIHYYGTLGKH